MPCLIPNRPIQMPSCTSPWNQPVPRAGQFQQHHPSAHPCDDLVPRDLQEQVQLVRTIHQILMLEEQKLEWMMKCFQAGKQSLNPIQDFNLQRYESARKIEYSNIMRIEGQEETNRRSNSNKQMIN